LHLSQISVSTTTTTTPRPTTITPCPICPTTIKVTSTIETPSSTENANLNISGEEIHLSKFCIILIGILLLLLIISFIINIICCVKFKKRKQNIFSESTVHFNSGNVNRIEINGMGNEEQITATRRPLPQIPTAEEEEEAIYDEPQEILSPNTRYVPNVLTNKPSASNKLPASSHESSNSSNIISPSTSAREQVNPVNAYKPASSKGNILTLNNVPTVRKSPTPNYAYKSLKSNPTSSANIKSSNRKKKQIPNVSNMKDEELYVNTTSARIPGNAGNSEQGGAEYGNVNEGGIYGNVTCS
jgi:hypothetical protein